MIPFTVEKRTLNLIVLLGPLTTLAISPWFNFDPINLVKVLFLTSLSFAAFGLHLPYITETVNRVGRFSSLILLIFCLWLFVSFFFSGANKSQQFWGVFGRNTGILTYIALVVVFFLTASVATRNSLSRILWSLVFTVVVMSVYCLFQIANLDPVSWSAYFPFGTLGNVNFLSGFMGIGLVTVFVLVFSVELAKGLRIFLSFTFVVGAFVLFQSDSTQGVVALLVGIASFGLIKSWFLNRYLFILTFIAYFAGFVALVLGLFDKGIFRSLIYQFTVLYRADYMHAGISMILNHPWTGVGIDSYDDWYRAERGIISAFRTSPSRTANSAHNISIDIGAGGGFPLLICYMIILAIVVFAFLKGTRNGLLKDPYFLAVSLSWLAYQVQASVSINQVGVGVWGWILGGALLGYSRLETTTGVERLDGAISKKQPPIKSSYVKFRDDKKTPNTPPALAVLGSTAMLALGFVLSFLPLKTDADFARASKIGSGDMLLEVTDRVSANSFMLSKSAVDSFRSNLPDLGKTITSKLTTKFPRTVVGWFITYENISFSNSERTFALSKINELDPYSSICYENDPETKIRLKLEKLSSAEKYKLAKGWGLTNQLQQISVNSFSFDRVPEELLKERIRSFCGI